LKGRASLSGLRAQMNVLKGRIRAKVRVSSKTSIVKRR
jgi:hypothetical protein